MKTALWIIFACLIPTLTYAEGYPVDGAWAAIIKNMPGTEVKACEAVRKFGVPNLTGHAVGDIVVFSGKKRLDFGGYADSESANVSVEAKPNGQFRIVDQYYDDGEGGTRPGPKKKIYLLKLVNASTLEISEGQYVSRYIKCASKNVDSASRAATAAQEKSEPAATLTTQPSQSKDSNLSKADLTSDKKLRGSILFIYQQYLVLKACEAKSDGLINLDSTRDSLKKFDQSIRTRGYDPDVMFEQAKNVPFDESLKLLLLSVSMLPMAQGAEKAQILSVCQRLIESEAQIVNLAISTPDSEKKDFEKMGKKDF
jgi:hypothetical protein